MVDLFCTAVPVTATLAPIVTATASFPFLTLAAGTAIVGLAGRKAVTDWQHDEQTQEIAGALDYLLDKEGQKNRALRDVLQNALNSNDRDFLNRLPDGFGTDPLTDFLSLLRAEGQEREKLLKQKQTQLTGISLLIEGHFDEIKSALDLQHNDLIELRNKIRSINLDIAKLLRFNRVTPPIWIPNRALEDATRFRFDARRVEMRGRSKELKELRAFLNHTNDERMFRWWLWTGEAGMGKSRLALELCREIWTTWEVGFLEWNTESFEKWDLWEPDGPTLIIFDYVAANVEKVRGAITTLMTRTLQHPVRFLLLERPIPSRDDWEETAKSGGASFSFSHTGGTWWNTLCSGDQSDTAPSRYSETRDLDGLDPPTAQAVLAELAEIERVPADEKTVERWEGMIRSVDGKCRPLLLAMGFEAIRDAGGNIMDWSVSTLVQHIIQREREKRWLPVIQKSNADTQQYLNLLLFAAMCPGLTIDSPVFEDDSLTGILPRKDTYDGSIYANLVPDADASRITAIEPDLLAECLVSVVLTNESSSNQHLIAAAWKHHPHQLFGFLLRLIQTFPAAEAIDHLLAAHPPEPARRLSLLHAIRAQFAFFRGSFHILIRSWTIIIEMADAPTDQRAAAYFSRGFAYQLRNQEGDVERAIADYSAVIDMAGAPSDQRVTARISRGFAYSHRGHEGDFEREIADYNAVTEVADAPAEERAMARFHRGFAYGQRRHKGDIKRAIADLRAIIDMPDAPEYLRASSSMLLDELKSTGA